LSLIVCEVLFPTRLSACEPVYTAPYTLLSLVSPILEFYLSCVTYSSVPFLSDVALRAIGRSEPTEFVKTVRDHTVKQKYLLACSSNSNLAKTFPSPLKRLLLSCVTTLDRILLDHDYSMGPTAIPDSSYTTTILHTNAETRYLATTINASSVEMKREPDNTSVPQIMCKTVPVERHHDRMKKGIDSRFQFS
jgi:hypothetical protein